MRFRLSTARRLVVWTVLVIVGGITLLISHQYARATDKHDHLAPSPDSLIITSRDRLAVCVQGIEGVNLDPAEVQAHMGAAFTAMSHNPYWAAAGFARAPAVAESGCPVPPVVLRPGVRPKPNLREIPGSRLTESPSKFLVFLFVAPPEFIDYMFLAGPDSSPSAPIYRIEVEEFVCFAPPAASFCLGVTVGLYLKPEELRDPNILTMALGKAIGLPRDLWKPPPDGPPRTPMAPTPWGSIVPLDIRPQSGR